MAVKSTRMGPITGTVCVKTSDGKEAFSSFNFPMQGHQAQCTYLMQRSYGA